MKNLLKKYEIELTIDEIKKFEEFLVLFKEKNSQINLSAIREDNDIIEKHFIDSIMLNVFLDLEWRVADMWTGWWFPLIPLAIVNPEVRFVWMDSVWKKIKAVWEFVKSLELKNIELINARAEEIWQDINHREKYDFVVSRATAYFPTLLEYTIPLLKTGWIFIAYKLDDKEELKSAKKALSKLNAKIIKVKNYILSEQKRTLIFIEKISPTHKKYPRRVWEPLKNPIK